MFYAIRLLRRSGKLGIVWIAATRGLRHISNADQKSVNVSQTCDDIAEHIVTSSNRPTDRFSLVLSAKLSNGVVRIHQTQVNALFADICKFITMINKPVIIGAPPGNLDDEFLTPPVPKKRKVTKKKPIVSSDDQDLVPALQRLVQTDVQESLEGRLIQLQTMRSTITMTEPKGIVPVPDVPVESEFGRFDEALMTIHLAALDATTTTEVVVSDKQGPPTVRPLPSDMPEIMVKEPNGTVAPQETQAPQVPDIQQPKRAEPPRFIKPPKKPVGRNYNIAGKYKKRVRINTSSEVENEENLLNLDLDYDDELMRDLLNSDIGTALMEILFPLQPRVTEEHPSSITGRPREPLQRPTPHSDITVGDIRPDFSMQPAAISTPVNEAMPVSMMPHLGITQSPLGVLLPLEEPSVQSPQIRVPTVEPGASREQILKAIMHYIIDSYKANRIPVTLEDVADKPLTKRSVAAAFGNVLELAKMQYVDLIPKANSLELSHINVGPKAFYFIKKD